jgi:hypothetical protein
VNVPQPGAFISNERNVTFSGSPPREVPSHERIVPGRKNNHTTPTVYNSGDVSMGKNAGHVSSTEVNIAQEGGDATFVPNTDISIGGGGDILGHRWSSEWFGKDWHIKSRRFYEGTYCRRCKHPGIRFENGVRVPLLTERAKTNRSAQGSSAR